MAADRGIAARVGLVVSPLLALGLLAFVDLDPARPQVTRMAAVAVLMAGWWITEAIPIPATAMLPVALFPLLGILPGKETAGRYFNHLIFLFLGGFLFALAMQRWRLHRRIALGVLLRVGAGPRRMVFGFMAATWFLSMWISNTATAMMLVPMAIAVAEQLAEQHGRERVRPLAVAILLGIAYSASVGGLATLIGTPPNLALARVLEEVFPDSPGISFADWFFFALPLSTVFLFVVWGLLCLLFLRGDSTFASDPEWIREERRSLGPMSFEERVIAGLFGVLVVAWMLRADIPAFGVTIPGWSRWLPEPGYVDDGTVAILLALILFLVPSRSRPGERLLDWETASGIRWGIVLLFGGGFALAAGFEASGLSAWLQGALSGLAGAPPLLLILAVCTLLTFLTELTSNTATTMMALPVLASVAVAMRTDPLALMVPATLSASCAFMLPVATPPNAIVFGSGEIRMADMIRAGLFLNLVGVLLVTSAVYLFGEPILGIEPGSLPPWAEAHQAAPPPAAADAPPVPR